MTILEEAQKLTRGDRRDAYGPVRIDFARIACMWTAILGVKVEPWHVPLCMIAVKISRECNAHKRDNPVDIAGYADTLQMLYDDEDEAATD